MYYNLCFFFFHLHFLRTRAEHVSRGKCNTAKDKKTKSAVIRAHLQYIFLQCVAQK